MKKSLLLSLIATGASVVANAYDLDSYIQTTQGGYYAIQAVSNDYLKNANALTDISGVISGTEGQDITNIFQWDSEKGALVSKVNTITEGGYIKLPISNGNTYIVSFKVRQQNAGVTWASNSLTTVADGKVNYVGSKGNGYNVITLVGTNGEYNDGSEGFVNVGHDFALTDTEWQTVDFVVDATETNVANWYFVMQGINTTLEIKDLELQVVQQSADLAKAKQYAAIAQKYYDAFSFEEGDGKELKDAVKTDVIDVFNGLDGEGDLVGYNDAVATFNGLLTPTAEGSYLGLVDNFIASCKSQTDFTAGKLSKLGAIGDWTLNFGRGFTQQCDGLLKKTDKTVGNDGTTALPYIEIGHYQQGSALGDDFKNASLKMTKTLKPGKYVFAIDGMSSARHANKQTWDFCTALSQGDMKLYVKSTAEGADSLVTSDWVHMPGTDYATGIVSFEIRTEGEYEIGVRLNWTTSNGTYDVSKYGGVYGLRDPRILCQLDGYSSAQTAYIDLVKAQIEALNTSYNKAKELIDANDANQPWLKTELKAKYEEMTPIVDAYNKITDKDIIDGFEDPVGHTTGGWAKYGGDERATDENTGKLIPAYNAADSIMNNAVRPMQYMVRDFQNANALFTNMDTAIEYAKSVLDMPVYSTCTGIADLNTAISTASAAKTTALGTTIVIPEATEEVTSPTYANSEQYTTLQTAIAALNTAVETFKGTLPESSIFNAAAPDFSKAEVTKNEDTGLYEAKVDGKTVLTLSNFIDGTETTEAQMCKMEFGYQANGETVHDDLLRVGNGYATMDVTTTGEAKERGCQIIEFDAYNVRLTDCSFGVSLKAAAESSDANVSSLTASTVGENKIAGFFHCSYSESESFKDFADLDWKKVPGLASGTAADQLVDAYKTHYEYLVDYTANTITLTTTNSSKGTQSQTIAFDGKSVAQVYIEADTKNYGSRRSWIGNLKVQQIKVDSKYTAISEVKSTEEVGAEKTIKLMKDGQLLIIKGGHTYNTAGQLIK